MDDALKMLGLATLAGMGVMFAVSTAASVGAIIWTAAATPSRLWKRHRNRKNP